MYTTLSSGDQSSYTTKTENCFIALNTKERRCKIEPLNSSNYNIDDIDSQETESLDLTIDNTMNLTEQLETDKMRERLLKDMALRGYKIGQGVLAKWKGDKEFYVAHIRDITYGDCVSVEFYDGCTQKIRKLTENLVPNPTREQWDEANRSAKNKYGGSIDPPMFPNPGELTRLKNENRESDILELTDD